MGFFGGGALDRILSTVDRKIIAETDREKLKADLVRSYYETRPGFMAQGGVWLMAALASPFVFWLWAVVLASVFWCRDCAFPQPWTIAALPPPLDDHLAIIIASIFGAGSVLGAAQIIRRR